jgi:hypothetical protein
MHPLSATGLYWSVRGEVACDEHAPPIEDYRWMLEGWDPVPVSSGHIKGTRYQCQHCAADGRVVVRNGHMH